MQFSARLQVTTVLHRLDDGDNPTDQWGSQITATSNLDGAGQMDLYLNIIGGTDLEPGDIIEVTGGRVPR